MKNRSIKKKKLIFLLTAVTVLSVAYLSYYYMLRLQLNWRICEIRKSGYPASPEELDKWYPSPYPKPNAADLYVEAFSSFNLNPENIDMNNVIICGDATMPPSSIPLGTEVLRNTKGYLSANNKTIEILHKVSGDKCCWDKVNTGGPEKPFIYLSNLMRAQRLLMMEALIAAEEGDNEKVFTAITSAISSASSLTSEHGIDPMLVEISLEKMIIMNFTRISSKTKFSAEQRAQLSAKFAELIEMKSLERALAAERVHVLTGYYLEEFVEYADYNFPKWFRGNPFLKKPFFFLFDISFLRIINNISCIDFLTELVEFSKDGNAISKFDNDILSELKNQSPLLFVPKLYIPGFLKIIDRKQECNSQIAEIIKSIDSNSPH